MKNYNSDNLGYLLNKVARTMRWHLNKKLDQYNLTASQWAVLKDLQIGERLGNTQSETPAAIAERLNVDRPTMSGIINRMCRNEWIYTEVNPEDRRSQLIKATDKSREVLNTLEDVSAEIVEISFRDFSSEEKEVMKDFLKRIIDNLS